MGNSKGKLEIMNLVKMNEQVIIAGAGPVGLTAALALCLKNIPVTIGKYNVPNAGQ